MTFTHRIIAAVCLILSVLPGSPCLAAASSIHDVESSDDVQRQMIDANFISPEETDRLIVYVSPGSAEALSSSDMKSPVYEWISGDQQAQQIFKGSYQNLSIRYQGEEILSSGSLLFDHIQLLKTCRGADGRDSLLFRMVTGGTANGEIEDMLFVYYRPERNAFEHRVIARRYLKPLCNMAGARGNQQQQKQIQQGLRHIFEQLSPDAEIPDLKTLRLSRQPIPTRQIGDVELEQLLESARHLVATETSQSMGQGVDADTAEIEQYIDHFEAELVFKDLAENDAWRIVEFSYLKLWSAWGVLLAQDKASGKWTVFYTSSAGDGNVRLYLDNQVTLEGSWLTGKFNPYALKPYVISLDGFNLREK